MPQAPDQKRPAGEVKKATDATGPLEFEKISVEDAKRALDRGHGAHQEAAERKARELADNVLLDATATWFGQLPAHVRPLEVGRRYRRIANRLSELWNRQAACESYFDELLAGRQSEGKILPAEIVAELTQLRAHHARWHAERHGVQAGSHAAKSGRSDADGLLEATATWLAQLPERTRPLELARQFPRIANKLCELWKRPSVCDRYLDDLVIDRRGGRKGFPLKIAGELSELRAYYTRLYPRSHGAWKDGDFMA